MKRALINSLIESMEVDEKIYMLVGDLGFGVMDPIIEKFPKRFFNMGICEQNMMSVAAGMSLEDNIVYTYSIGNFPTLRALEQIRNDILYNNLNVKIVSVGSGFAYGSLGMSHHATEDIAVMRALPNIVILSPADPMETFKAVQYANKINGPVYIRIGRGGEENIPHIENEIEKGILKVREGNGKIALLSTSTITKEVLKSAVILEEKGVDIAVYSVAIIKPLNEKILIELSEKFEYIITIEEHNIVGGLGSAVAEILTDNECNCIQKRIGIRDKFIDMVGEPNYLRECCGLTGEKIAEYVQEVLR